MDNKDYGNAVVVYPKKTLLPCIHLIKTCFIKYLRITPFIHKFWIIQGERKIHKKIGKGRATSKFRR